MTNNFTDQVVFISGAGRGLGRALALAFASQGAIVAANDLTPVNLDDTLELIRAGGGQALECLGDVSNKMVVQGLLENLVDHYGRLDIVINNAAVQPRHRLLEMDEWDWRRTLEVNLTAPFFVTQVAGRVMRTLGGGIIVNIGDATPDFTGKSAAAGFAASKAGLVGLTRAAARELAVFGVRVVAVCPGLLDSPATHEAYPAETLKQALETTITAGRLGSLDEAAAAVLFACSPAGAYLTGQTLELNGGGWGRAPHRSV